MLKSVSSEGTSSVASQDVAFPEAFEDLEMQRFLKVTWTRKICFIYIYTCFNMRETRKERHIQDVALIDWMAVMPRKRTTCADDWP